MSETRTFDYVGTRPIRHDGLDKVTGTARYGADVHLPEMLHAKMLRSPHGHARILSIDTSRAEALPGVHAIVTSADMPEVSDKIQEMGEDADYLYSTCAWNPELTLPNRCDTRNIRSPRSVISQE